MAGGRPLLIQRSRNDHELFPDAICVIGAPEAGDELVMEYFDSRGVRRTYGVSLDDDMLRMWREHPGFDQRFSATLGTRKTLKHPIGANGGAWLYRWRSQGCVQFRGRPWDTP